MSRDWGLMCGRPDGDPRPGRPVCAAALTLSGLLTLAVLACGMVVLARDSSKGRPDDPARGRIRRVSSPVGSVAFAPDGGTLALAYLDGTVEIQDLGRGRPLAIEAGSHVHLARCVVFSPDGKVLASAGGPGVKFWDATTGELLGSLDGMASPAVMVAFSPDGRTLAVGSADGSVRLRDVDSGRESARMVGHAGEIRGLAFAPDGKTLATGSFDGSVRLWDVATGRERAGLDGRGRRVYSLAFAPDGKTLAVGYGATRTGIKGLVVVWDLSIGREAVRIIGHASFASVAFAPDGKTLAGAGGDRVVKLWDVETGEELASLAGHEGFIASVAYSPDGRFLATGGQDARLGLFDLGHDPGKATRHHL